MFLVVRIFRVIIAAAIALVLAMPVAYAQPSYERHVREGRRQGESQNQPPSRNPREAQRSYGKRGEDAARRDQRLSPEERRELRRDIREAGREIYLPRR